MFKDEGNRGGIFRSEASLTADRIPDQLINRGDELDRIANAIRPLTRGNTPENLLIYGPAGVGKTTCVKHVFDRLETETNVKVVYINCWQYTTRPALLTELLVQLGYPAPRKGKPVDELLSKLKEWLDKNRGFAVALDEFDQLDGKTEIVYDLQMLNSEAENKLGIVMVSNQHPSRLQLDPRSRSRLNCQTLEFQSYNVQQLVEILENRVEQAFRPGSVDDAVMEMIAEQVSEEGGDCRQALELLLRAGRKADQNGERQVTLETLEAVD